MALVGTISDGNGFTVEIWATESNGSTTFTVKVVEGEGDLRGFFFDYVGENLEENAISGEAVTAQHTGTSFENDVIGTGKGNKAVSDDITQVGHNDNNMNGTGVAFDAGVQFGGPGDDGLNEVTFTIEGLTLDEIDGMNFGIRANSIGEDGYGVKLVGQFDVPEEQPPADHFENFKDAQGHDISHVTLYWEADGDLADTKGTLISKDNGKGTEHAPDGWFTVKIDVPKEFNDDLDDNLDAILDALIAAGHITEAHKSSLVGVSIKGGQVEQWYDFNGSLTDNDPSPDPDLAPDVWIVENKELDVAYEGFGDLHLQLDGDGNLIPKLDSDDSLILV